MCNSCNDSSCFLHAALKQCPHARVLSYRNLHLIIQYDNAHTAECIYVCFSILLLFFFHSWVNIYTCLVCCKTLSSKWKPARKEFQSKPGHLMVILVYSWAEHNESNDYQSIHCIIIIFAWLSKTNNDRKREWKTHGTTRALHTHAQRPLRTKR